MDVSKNSGTPKSSILIGFSIINHPFWGTPIFGNTHMKNGLFFHPPRHGNLSGRFGFTPRKGGDATKVAASSEATLSKLGLDPNSDELLT